jgi:hypothetical protein
MTLPQLSKALTSVYNSLGNEWITENLVSEPFDFRVYVRKGDEIDLYSYVVEVYTDRPIPKIIPYKDPSKQPSKADGIHYSKLQSKFKELANYVETFGGFGKTLTVEFMDLKHDNSQ